MILTLFILLFVLLFLNLPVFMALVLSSMVTFKIFTTLPLEIVAQRMFAGINSFALMAVPFFIFAATVMNKGGLAPRIVRFANTLVRHLPGGLAFTIVLSCMFLGAVSGSAPATVVAIASLMLQPMSDSGYSKSFTLGLIIASASVAVIIPPSIGMIVYGAVTGTSVGELFIAGFLPGAIYCIGFMLYSYVYAKKKGLAVQKRATLQEIFKAFKHAGWSLGIPVIVIGGIYGGVFTPTEAAGIAAAYSIFVALVIYKEMNVNGLMEAAFDSAIGTAQIMILLAGASVFAWLLTRQQVPQILAEMMISVASTKFLVLMMTNVILLIAGMFLDPASIQMIMAPLFLPLALQFNITPVHLGIIMVVNGAIGMFTPPFGLNLFVASAIAKVPLGKLVRPVIPFIIISLVSLLLITYIPQISLWLPDLLFRK